MLGAGNKATGRFLCTQTQPELSKTCERGAETEEETWTLDSLKDRSSTIS